METIIRQEAEWILSQQLPGGAVVTAYPGQPKIVPYFAHLALYGLAAWGLNLSRVRAYLDWYLARLERPDRYGVTGTVYDYHLEGEGAEIPAYTYDSSDSYAATFLTLVRLYYGTSGDRAWLEDHWPELDLVAGAMLATLQRDNLTLARPDWRVKYLMDNCEVYRGLKDYAWLLAQVRRSAGEAERYEALAGKVREAIEAKMRVNGGYCPAIYRAGLRRRPNWKKWYPDALAQLFPIITGVVTLGDDAARRLYGNFLRNYPHWHRQAQPENFTTTLVLYAAALMEDRWRVRQYVAGLEENIIARGHPWPYHAAEAGILLLAIKAYLTGSSGEQWY
ncbi:hypothetical protein MOTE_04670 [Moorella thermoacetica]|uniref:Uncharacterized protein n=1 Tax=Neomoorella thermoacetica TaxID=1525 RepID=A0A1J5P686_NEOTH|nr:hypothetical protein MOTE_04670 [Moorella thermoacetica]